MTTVGAYADERPKSAEEILPDDFASRFNGLTTLTLSDLELPDLPSALSQCKVTSQAIDKICDRTFFSEIDCL